MSHGVDVEAEHWNCEPLYSNSEHVHNKQTNERKNSIVSTKKRWNGMRIWIFSLFSASTHSTFIIVGRRHHGIVCIRSACCGHPIPSIVFRFATISTLYPVRLVCRAVVSFHTLDLTTQWHEVRRRSPRSSIGWHEGKSQLQWSRLMRIYHRTHFTFKCKRYGPMIEPRTIPSCYLHELIHHR